MVYDNFIKNKKVLLLGPAPYVLKKKWDFDKFDIVCKINRMMFMDFGKTDRCDVLYCNIDTNKNLQEEEYKYNTISCGHFRIAYPPINHYYKKNYNNFLNQNLNHSVFPAKRYVDLAQLCNNTSPNTGVIAIYDLLQCNPRELHISGITMFSGGYADGYRGKQINLDQAKSINKKIKNHNIYYQAKAVFPMMSSDIVFMDKEVQDGFLKVIQGEPEWKR